MISRAALLLAVALLPASCLAAGLEGDLPAGDPLRRFDEAVQSGDAAAALEAAEAAAAAHRGRLASHPARLADALEALGFRIYQELSGGPEGETAAERLFLESLALRRRAFGELHLDVAKSLDLLSGVHFFQGRFDEAESEERQALAVRAAILPAGAAAVAKARDGLGAILSKQGRFSEAEPLLLMALADFRASDPPDLERASNNLNMLAELARARGDFETAEKRFVDAMTLVDAAAAVGGAAWVGPERLRLLNNLAGLRKDQGRFDEAEDSLRQVLALRQAEARPDPAELATTWLNLGEIARFQGLIEEAESRYSRALELAGRALGADNPELAWFLNQTAVLRREQGRLAEAARLQAEAVGLLRRTLGERHFQTAQALHDQGRLELVRGRPEMATAMLREALAIRRQVYGDSHPDVAMSRIELAKSLAASGTERSGPEGSRPAVAPPAAGDAAALEEIDLSIEILGAGATYPEALAEAHAVRADLWRRAGRPEEAIEDLREMARLVDAVRPHTGGGEAARAGFLSRYAAWHDRLVLDLLHAGRLADAFETAERGRSRALLDQLALARVDLRASIPEPQRQALAAKESAATGRLAELQERIAVMRGRDDLVPEEKRRRVADLETALVAAARHYADVYNEVRSNSPLWRATAGSPPVSLAEAQGRLVPPRGLLLLYVIGDEESAVMTIPAAPEPARWHPLVVVETPATAPWMKPGPLGAADLRRLMGGGGAARGVLAAMASPPARLFDDGGDLATSLNDLWRLLMPRPAWSLVRHADEVVILPDGPIAGLPFEALAIRPGRTAAAARYWIDGGPPVRYADSATLLRDLTRRPASPTAGVLSVSDPIAGVRFGGAGEALARLPGTARETEAIQAAFGEGVLALQGVDANEPGVRRALAPGTTSHRYLHLAVHGLVNQEMGELFAALALTPPRSPTGRAEDDGLLQLFEIYDLDLACELAVLSACGTGTGRQVDGEGVFALSRGFLTAGARRVVASQWPVEDASTAALMGEFFGRIAKAEARGDALRYAWSLRESKRAVRRKKEWAAPFYWAPFVLGGMGEEMDRLLATGN